jgi:hypothetical protein
MMQYKLLPIDLMWIFKYGFYGGSLVIMVAPSYQMEF